MSSNNSNETDSLYEGIPYTFDVSAARFWVHFAFVILGFLLAVVTFLSQRGEPAPYGKHTPDQAKKGWGPMIPQRIAHMTSDGLCCVIFFLLIFFLYGQNRTYTSYVFLGLWQLHYVHRGLLHPLLMRYSKTHVQLGITAGTVLPNLLYSFINSDWISTAVYDDYYYRDPRFLIGILLFVIGFIINRWADVKLRSMRQAASQKESVPLQAGERYKIPHGGLYEYISCPNYFGEAVEWLGWTIATWSLAGLVWLLFCLATFVPRAGHNHEWYLETFSDYPKSRKRLIPFVY